MPVAQSSAIANRKPSGRASIVTAPQVTLTVSESVQLPAPQLPDTGAWPGSVIVDVAVDQGGCVETIHPTTHSDPTYVVHDVIHYGVANMPGAVPRTSTLALTNTTLPFVECMSELGVAEALRSDPALAQGANIVGADVVCEGVAESLGLPYTPLTEALSHPSR